MTTGTARPVPDVVLLTRPAADERTAGLVAARGFRPLAAPMLRVAQRIVVVPPGTAAILVTSGNALPALPVSAVPLLAVGDATAARAQALGFPRVLSASGDAMDLAELVTRAADPRAGPLLLASGAGQGSRLAAELRRRGFRVVRRVAYAARPAARFPAGAAHALRDGEVHAATFLSAETASTFVRLLPPALHASLGTVSALAIGEAAARALEELPWLHVCRAQNPTLDDVLALL